MISASMHPMLNKEVDRHDLDIEAPKARAPYSVPSGKTWVSKYSGHIMIALVTITTVGAFIYSPETHRRRLTYARGETVEVRFVDAPDDWHRARFVHSDEGRATVEIIEGAMEGARMPFPYPNIRKVSSCEDDQASTGKDPTPPPKGSRLHLTDADSWGIPLPAVETSPPPMAKPTLTNRPAPPTLQRVDTPEAPEVSGISPPPPRSASAQNTLEKLRLHPAPPRSNARLSRLHTVTEDGVAPAQPLVKVPPPKAGVARTHPSSGYRAESSLASVSIFSQADDGFAQKFWGKKEGSWSVEEIAIALTMDISNKFQLFGREEPRVWYTSKKDPGQARFLYQIMNEFSLIMRFIEMGITKPIEDMLPRIKEEAEETGKLNKTMLKKLNKKVQRYIRKAFDITYRCFELGNFYHAQAIIGILNKPAIFRLNKNTVRSAVGVKSIIEKYKEMNLTFTASTNFQSLRDTQNQLHKEGHPCAPYLGPLQHLVQSAYEKFDCWQEENKKKGKNLTDEDIMKAMDLRNRQMDIEAQRLLKFKEHPYALKETAQTRIIGDFLNRAIGKDEVIRRDIEQKYVGKQDVDLKRTFVNNQIFEHAWELSDAYKKFLEEKNMWYMRKKDSSED